MSILTEETAWLVLRMGVAAVYIYAATQNLRFFTSYTVPETQLLFRGLAVGTNKSFVAFAAAIGVAVMFIAAGAIALGAAGRIAAPSLAVFTAMGFQIHRVRWLEARKAAESAQGAAQAMCWSAYSGHFSSALKNLALIAVLLFMAVMGTGPMSIWPV